MPPPFTTIAWRLGQLSEMLALRQEVLHHGAEIALLRDLYRVRQH
ncbi:hypothetical protein ACFQ4H_05860 [Micromonospora sonneratiae]|uniref:Uncharacterized protein n=1 Tax=Micromonospora sonneratiae TaxID=1184706 RepID=A0ABW3YB12_9ACTN